MNNSVKLFLLLLGIVVSGFHHSQFIKYPLVYSGEHGSISFGEFYDSVKRMRPYQLIIPTHYGEYRDNSDALFDNGSVTLNPKKWPDNNSVKYSIVKTANNSKQLKIIVDKKLLPVYFQINDSSFVVKQNSLNLDLVNSDSATMRFISNFNDIGPSESITVSSHMVVNVNSRKANIRGDLRPEPAKIKYGYIDKDTLKFLGKNGLIYKFIRKLD